MLSPITEEEAGDLPCAVHGVLLILFLFLTYIPPLPSSVLPLLLCLLVSHPLSPMSHDETHTHYLQPYYSSAPSSDPQSSNKPEDGPFDPGNTPPLIFAFIAVGFIIFGLIVAVVYKKCRPTPNSRDPHHHQRSSIPIRRPSIQKPRLWDVWIAPGKRSSDEEQANVNDWDTLAVSRIFVYVVDRSVDELPSLYQRRLYTLTPPLPLSVCPNNTFRATSRDPFSGRTPSTGCSSDTLQQTQASMSLS